MVERIMRDACGFGMQLFNRISGRSLRLKSDPGVMVGYKVAGNVTPGFAVSVLTAIIKVNLR